MLGPVGGDRVGQQQRVVEAVDGEVRPGRQLTLVVADNGQGMVPRPDSPGLGLGLPLIATLTTSLEIGSKGAGSALRMTFDLDGTGNGATA